ncbi:MAG: DUF3486 family protein [Burkholderiales bacterium]|nr:DUF3486 family protein [Burkholderiales bacterium]
MGDRSKVLDLPEVTRAELDARLIGGGFTGYVELAEWLRGQGFEVSKSSLHRYGSKLDQRVAELKRSTEQARALVAAAPDESADMSEALMRLMQEKLFTLLMEMDVDPEQASLGAIAKAMAPLARASIALKQHAASVAEKARTAADQATRIATAGGLSAESADEIRRAILGIAA